MSLAEFCGNWQPAKPRLRLASRGAQFGDSSYYITYRNVSLLHLRRIALISVRTDLLLSHTHPQQVILGVIGVPGAFLAGWAVEQPYIGRKGTLALSAGEYPVSTARVFIIQRPPRVT